MKQFSIHIKNSRKEKGLSQRSLANKIGCPPTTLSGWEQGKFLPNKKFRPALCSTLGLTLEQITDTREMDNEYLNLLAIEKAQSISQFEEIEENMKSDQLSDLIKGYWILNEKERYQLIEVMKVLISSRKF